ncbi:MAG TPA: anthranilate phosphoribosyltransferase [Spirochaetota bacterium]|nr:anthranilate phosphoribosyltransferase [Spirochaetota bacterium]
MILFIDNYDSFTYNLVDYFGQLNPNLMVVRNDAITVDEVREMAPTGIVISPGPGSPVDAGVSCNIIREFHTTVPILGVCLGHQCIGEVFGGRVKRAPEPVHGKTAEIYHKNDRLFGSVPLPFSATRYHSLIIEREGLPDELQVIAETNDNIIMGVRHRSHPTFGVQFHPESILTTHGMQIIANWLAITAEHAAANAKAAVPAIAKPAGENAIRPFLEKITAGKDLAREEASCVLEKIIAGDASETEIGALLVGLRIKGETVDELVGFVDTMERHMDAVSLADADAIDVCGTGGDSSFTFNVSTTAALVIAAGGVTVAKHGNRSISSKTGSADLLEALGVKIDLNSAQVKRCIDEIGIGFFFAPLFHPAMKAVAPYRKKLGLRTFFNMLGPMLNPARVTRQLVGAFNLETAGKIAAVLQARGSRKVCAVHGNDGLDEISIFADTTVFETAPGVMAPRRYEYRPPRANATASLAQVKGAGIDDNIRMTMQVLQGERSTARDMTVVNAAFGFYVAGRASSIEDGIRMAEESIDSGAALKKLSQFKDFSLRI